MQVDSFLLHATMFSLGWVIFRWLRLTSLAAVTKCSSFAEARVLDPGRRCSCDWTRSPTSIVRSSPSSTSTCAPPSPPLPSPVSVAAESTSGEVLDVAAVTGAFLACGLGTLLTQRCASCGQENTQVSMPPPWRRTSFHGALESSSPITKLAVRFYEHVDCSAACVPLALCYLDRAQKASTRFELSGHTCARLLLAALVLATKYHDDDFPPFSAEHYASVGGLHPREFVRMERDLCMLLGWKLFVKPDEFDHYHNLLYSAALAPDCGESGS